jgi:hypothetical protein
MLFAVPMIWRELTDQVTGCKFCMVPAIQKGITKKKKLTVEYPNIPSGICPVPNCESLPFPKPPQQCFPRLCKEEENTSEETLQPSTSETWNSS